MSNEQRRIFDPVEWQEAFDNLARAFGEVSTAIAELAAAFEKGREDTK